MAQRRALEPLMHKPAPGPMSELPTEGPDNGLDMVLRALTTGLGLEEQKPGDLPSAIGAGASMLPIGKLLQMLGRGGRAVQEAKPAVNIADSMLRNHLYDELPEFAPVTHGVHPDLDPQEALKAMELTSQKRRP